MRHVENHENANTSLCKCGHLMTVNENLDHTGMNFQKKYIDESTLKSRLKKELLTFCKNTTIRGLPRIVKARNSRLRTTWFFFVILLIVGCFTCMFLLAKQYRNYDVIMPPRLFRNHGSPFPSVTICNVRPISPTGVLYMQNHNWKSPREFAQDVNAFAKKSLYRKNRTVEYFKATAAFSLAGYLESLDSEEGRRKLGYQQDKLIIKCQASYLNGSKRVAAPCRKVGRWRNFIHALYLNCATFDLKSHLRNSTKTLEIYIYLDEDLNAITCPDCFHGEIKSQLSGAVISVHNSDTLADINDKSINLKPGTLTEIRLRIIENIHQKPPYGHCSGDTPEHIQCYGKDYIYSEHACRQKSIQEDIQKQCKCQAIEYPYVNNSKLPFCSRLPNFVNKDMCNKMLLRSGINTSACQKDLEEMVEKIRCKITVTQKYSRDVVPTCLMPCLFNSYETDRSTSTWPTKSWQLPWINSNHYNKTGFIDRPELEPYRRALKLFRQKKTAQAKKLLDKTKVLERNLLAVLINRPNFDLNKVEEKEVLSLTSFLSQAGGLFSIWIGLTMISVVEIMELIVHFCAAFTNNKKSKTSNNRRRRKKKTPLHSCDIANATNGDVERFSQPSGSGDRQERRTSFVTANNYTYSCNNDYGFLRTEQANIETVL